MIRGGCDESEEDRGSHCPHSGDASGGRVFGRIAAAGIPNVQMRTLSMGMSNSYEVAIEEGANLVRIGTKLFGPRIT